MTLTMVLLATLYQAPSTVLDAFPGLGAIATFETMTVQVGQWRNAYPIHEWMLRTLRTEDDESHEADEEIDSDTTGKLDVDETEILQRLLSKVQKVLADPEKAPEILPDKSYKYSPDSKYGNKYLADLTRTQEILQNALSPALHGWHLTYEWSW